MLYLSQAIGRPVLDAAGEPLGRVDDLIVALGDRYPPVTGLVLRTDKRLIFLPWTSVASFDAAGGRLSTATIDITAFKQRPNEIQLRADLLDKQIVDIDGRKVVRVNDLRLDDVDGMLHLVAVDVGAAGLLRRLGIEGPFRVLARNVGLSTPERYIDWEDVDPVETSIASIKLRVPHAGLAELHPADLATIIDQLAPRDRAGVLASLDDEAAADAIEEMEPDTQVEVLEDLAPERAADILEEMSPDDAADLVADLSDETRAELLALMERDEADELGELLRYPEDTAGGTMTTEFVAVPADLTRGRHHRPAARARARRRDHLLRLRRRRRGAAGGRPVAARPDRRAAGQPGRRGHDPGAGRRGRAGRPRRGRRGGRPLQPAGRARGRRGAPPRRHRDRGRRHGHHPARRLAAPAAATRRARLGDRSDAPAAADRPAPPATDHAIA